MKKYCVIGYPIKHSLSPKIFNRAFRRLKIPAQYSAVEVRSENLAKFMRDFHKKYAGASVTIPHKERIIKFLDKLSPEAAAIGAVNVIINQGGKLIGYNTDVFGAMTALKSSIKNLHSKNAIVLGAGGAARAVVYGLKKAGAQVTILNRTLSHAKRLARDFKCKFDVIGKNNLEQCDILINATSVGMWPQKAKTPLSDFLNLVRGRSKKPVVMEVVYRPRITLLLRDAKRAGCSIITGDKMFSAQAAKTFKLWTGKKETTISSKIPRP